MINELKKLVEKYVKDPASVEVFIAGGDVSQEFPSLYLKETIFVHIKNLTVPYRNVLAAVSDWYQTNHGGLTDAELKKGMSFFVEPLKENDAFIEISLTVRARAMMSYDNEGLMNAVQCG